MKRKIFALTGTSLFMVALLSSCSSPARIVNKNQSATAEPEVSTSVPATQTTSPSSAVVKNIESYDIQEKIASQISGEVKDTFEYLVHQRGEAVVHLEDVHLGYFTQNQNGEILVTYHVEDGSRAENPTFFFILDVYTGELLSSFYLTADQVDFFLLDSPMGTKIFVTQNSEKEGVFYSNATIYSCLSGEWAASSALTEHNTMVESEALSLSMDYVYTYQNDVLLVESQVFSSTVEREPVDEDMESLLDEETDREQEELAVEEELAAQSGTLEFHGNYTWNHDLSIFQSKN